MNKRLGFKIVCAGIITTLLFVTNVYASTSNISLTIDGKQTSGNVKTIDGKTYIALDALNSVDGLTISKTSQNVSISTNNISNIVTKVSPSVVGIIGKLKESSSNYNEMTDNLVFGTGVIYRSDGYIVTNAHVVKEMESIVVVLSNSKPYKARLKAIDEKLDLATIKIDKGGLTPATFGDIKKATVGQEVVAIGTPLSFSLRNSATRGIVSGMNRVAGGEYRFIQSDTAINGGNSGGPLVNMQGQVIGINSVKFMGYGVEGLSFSIPIDTVQYAIKHFEKFGKIKRPYLGLNFSESIAAQYGLPTYEEGINIQDIDEGSPAENFDLSVEDKLLAVNGVKVNTIIDFNEEMKKYYPGDSATFLLVRDGKKFSVDVRFSEKD